jgi:hypothetical protein
MDDLTWSERRALARIEEGLNRDDPAFVRRVNAISGLALQEPTHRARATVWMRRHRVAVLLFLFVVLSAVLSLAALL